MIELLAPAGDLEKLKVAILYGADAVFVGGENFSLRARASNFKIDTIKDAATFVHMHGKKLYVTVNIIPHEHDFEGLVEYLKALEEAGVDAIIAASPGIIEVAKKNTSLEIHLSTQQSALNESALKFWKSKGIKRAVLGRELSIEDIEHIAKQNIMDIEVFVHGGMCMSFSGRCSLSDNFTSRDANRGGCAHSCRWMYTMNREGKAISEHPFTMGSKDLSGIEYVSKLIDANVTSLKIEGRMKSLHYVASIVSIYRKAIDEYMKQHTMSTEEYKKDIQTSENRPSSYGYLNGMPTLEDQLFSHSDTKPKQTFIGVIKGFDKEKGYTIMEQRNFFKRGQKVHIISPNHVELETVIHEMYDENMQPLEFARHAKQLMYVNINQEFPEYALVRKAI